MKKKWTAENVKTSLQEIKIASPCHVPLDKMEDRGNCFYCHDCKLNVYHFSTLSNAEIALLLNANNEKLCVGMFKREDGTIITKDCPLGLADLGMVYRRGGVVKAASFLLVLLLSTSIASVLDPIFMSFKLKMDGAIVRQSDDDSNKCDSFYDQYSNSCMSITHPKVIEEFTKGNSREISSAFMGKREN